MTAARTKDQITPKAAHPRWKENDQRRTRSRKCELRSCDNTTRENKPYCPDHVEHNEYVSKLVEALEERERVTAAVKKGRAKPKASDLLSKEILLELRVHGPRTAARLSRSLNEDFKVIERYAKALKKEKLVELTKTRRGTMTLHLKASA